MEPRSSRPSTPTAPSLTLRYSSRALVTAIVAGLSLFAVHLLRTPAEATIHRAHIHEPTPESSIYAASAWHPDLVSLSAVTEMAPGPSDHHPLDNLRLAARSAFVFDVNAGETLLEQAADNRQPVASLTKLVSSMALASTDPNLDQQICVDHRLYPSRSGARSHLSTGDCYLASDLLGATLVASDNRAAYGLQVASGLDFDAFVDRMGEVSRQVGMTQSTWADPAGLEDDNISTARDMARAAVAVSSHPILAGAATASSWALPELLTNRVRTLFSTDRMAGRGDLEVLAAKTGYTDTAGYCFAGVFSLRSGRTIALSVLGAGKSNNRWRDVEKILAAID